MTNKKEYLLDLILNKLKQYPIKINLEKKEFTKFINDLINNKTY